MVVMLKVDSLQLVRSILEAMKCSFKSLKRQCFGWGLCGGWVFTFFRTFGASTEDVYVQDS